MLKPELKHSLQDTKLGKYLDGIEIDMLLTHTNIAEFPTGTTILVQGQKSEGIYIILDGIVITTAKLLGEGTTNIGTLERGDFLGEISFIENGPTATSAIASSSVKCLFISRLYFELLSVYFPETKYKILRAITVQVCHRLKCMHEKITQLINNTDMTARSLFGEMMHSLSKPSEIKLEEAGLAIDDLFKSSFFSQFTQAEFEQLLQHSTLLKASKNCTLIHEGEKNACCYIVIHGAVQSSIVQNNKVAKLSVIGPMTLFASISCFDTMSSFTITFATCEPAVMFKLSETDLEFIRKNNQRLWYKVFGQICHSLVALEKSIDKLDIRLSIETYNR